MDEMDVYGMIVFIVLVICLGGFIWYMANKEQKEVDFCFMQEPRTKECELVLYKYEHHSRNRTIVVPMPVVVRR